MVILKQVRLVNWYAFNHNTFPIGRFTLIMGRNGSGKSVILDAIRYGAFGDTAFNKSTDTQGKRTLSTYTRGFMDATSNTYMRPADKYPTLTTHIALEYYDDSAMVPFILGTLIETDSKNTVKTWRYVLEGKTMQDVSHTIKENGTERPKTREELKKEWKVRFMGNEEGLEAFMQMTGLNMTKLQVQTFLKKIRGILTYNPKSRIEQFIKESVLEPREIRFDPLVQSMERIDRLNGELSQIEREIGDLEAVTDASAAFEKSEAIVRRDDIMNAYKDYHNLDDEITGLAKKQSQISQQVRELKGKLEKKTEEEREVERKIRQLNLSLDNMDCMEPIRMEQEHLEKLQDEASALKREKERLERAQTVVSEAMAVLQDAGIRLMDADVLASLSLKRYTETEKRQAVEAMQEQLTAYADSVAGKMLAASAAMEENAKKVDEAAAIIRDCDRKQGGFSQIPRAYIALRDEINAEYKKRGIHAEAKFAYEYVQGLMDETWRPALETFLGARRYTILTDPDGYDVAFGVFIRSANRSAHLFNTKLLMQEKITEIPQAASSLLQVQNPVAKKYFTYFLGRMKALPTQEVKKERNAISKEGCVSVSMDTYFLPLEKTRGFLLGQAATELTKEKMQKELTARMQERDKLAGEKRALEEKRDTARRYAKMDTSVQFDAAFQYQETVIKIRESMQAVEQLKYAQKHNQDFTRMEQERDRLDHEIVRLRDEKQQIYAQITDAEAKIAVIGTKTEEKQEQLERAEDRVSSYEIAFDMEAVRISDEYDAAVEAGRKPSELVLGKAAREEAVAEMTESEEQVKQYQYNYNANWGMENQLPVGLDKCPQYLERKEKIWMGDLQDVKAKIAQQKEKYESDFRTEFVLRIYTACVDAMREITRMNHKLAKLNFKEKYQFEILLRNDGTDFAKIIRYAQYMTDRAESEMLDPGYTEEDVEEMEQEIKTIIRNMVENGKEETIAQFSDYRNYMSYDILINNAVFKNARLSKQTSYESGAEVQIPYMLILLSALLITYDAREGCAKLVFIDEPFAKMDPGNVKLMLDFMKSHGLQMIFCAPDKVELIGNECEVVLPVLKVRADVMKVGSIKFHEFAV